MSAPSAPKMSFGISLGCKVVANLAAILVLMLIYGPVPVISLSSMAIFLCVTIAVRLLLDRVWRLAPRKATR